ncbi:MAG: hypothetical protein E7D92_00985 [Anaerococcus sp.]|uniref:hypothetical protein n=1 Tax=Anaerococcus sp. TaxID=1872515 RepID=UPI002902B676|nr:hypothetical protein [Anaerococcus sp.]MDU2353170.1 hypothetical protein [Anaerococcus sp.]
MAKKERNPQKNTHIRPKHRKVYIFPYIIIALLIIGIPFAIYQLYISNVNRNVDKLTEAIQNQDMEYLEKKTDRLPIILDVLEKSYSEDPNKQKEFYDNNFKNLKVKVIGESKKSNGKEVTIEVSNVNYIDVFEKLPEDADDVKLHKDYMVALSDPNQELNTRKATVYFERKFNGYKFNESREFVNAILGGALEYAEDGEDLSQNNKDASESSNNLH